MFFIYDPMGGGQKESIRNATSVYIKKEADIYTASSGLVVSTMSRGKEWTYVECIAQTQIDAFNCGTLVLIAFFRIVSLVSRNTSLQVITSRWYFSVTALAYRAYRKEILHLLTDVFEVEVMSQREVRAAADVPRPSTGKQYAGFFYYHEVLIPKLQTENQTFY